MCCIIQKSTDHNSTDKCSQNEPTDEETENKNRNEMFLSTHFQLTSLLENRKEPLSQLVTVSVSLCMYISACNAGDRGSIPGSGSSHGEGIGCPLQCSWASLVAQIVKNLPALWETWVCSLGWEDPLEKGMATHSSILVWRIPWTEEAGGLQSIEFHGQRSLVGYSPWGCKAGHD